MDIEDLNKSQLILLAVLLSFITSIATGITTVSLMQQAPTSITFPINRVIKQTVEKIEQVEGKTTVQTVVVKEEDLVVDAISKNQSAVFAVSKDGYDVNGSPMELAEGRGFTISQNGIIVAGATGVGEKGNYYVKNSSGKFKAEFLDKDAAGFSFLKIGEAVDGKSKLNYTVPSIGDLSKMKVGQKIIVIGSSITSSIYAGDNNVNLSVSPASSGGLVLDLDGNALGMALSGDTNSFVTINTIIRALKILEASDKPKL